MAMAKLQHGSHECALTSPKIVADGICNICYKDETVEFACDPCNFDLCKSCSELPLKMSHNVHPEHALEFCIAEYDQETRYMICFGCGKMSSVSFHYECKKCEIYLDIDCALHKSIVTGWFAKEMFHYSHEHLLRRCRPGPEATGSCLLCELPLSPSSICYGCIHCHLFLHERCLDLPTKIQHPVHPLHPLKRLDYIQTFDGKKNCSACKGKFVGVPFGCLECGLYLHLRCADALLRGLMHESHEHRLIYVEDNGRVDATKDMSCPICMDIVLYNRFYYLCVECDLKFHVDCLEIPNVVVKKSFHIHQLGQKIFRDEDESLEFCGVCETILRSGYPVYSCQECDFLGHTECILREEVPAPLYLKDMYHCIEDKATVTDLEDYDINNVEDKLMINGFNHIHVMRPVHMSELENEAYCNMCGGKVDDSPRKCETCSFQSHSFCAELGGSSRHQFHLNHTLTLLPHPPRCVKRKCDSCKRNIDGFNLFCRICDFIIDINCVLKDRKMLGVLHVGQKVTGTWVGLCMQDKHSMFQVIVSSSHPIACAICDEKLCGKALSCVTCEDIFHPLCIQDGRRGLVGHPLHPDHKLRVSHAVRPSNCLACNMSIRKYGYCCSICAVMFHIECIKVVSVPRTIKPHNHYFYHFWNDDSRVTRTCSVCATPCGVSFYGCIDCNFVAHAACVGYPNNVKSQKHQHTLAQISCSRRHKCFLCGSSTWPNRIYLCYHCNDSFETHCLMSRGDREAATEEEQLQDIYLMYLERDLFNLLRYNES